MRGIGGHEVHRVLDIRHIYIVGGLACDNVASMLRFWVAVMPPTFLFLYIILGQWEDVCASENLTLRLDALLLFRNWNYTSLECPIHESRYHVNKRHERIT